MIKTDIIMVNNMKYQFSCSDIGMSCDFKTENESREQLMQQITEHAKSAHQMDPISEDVKAKVEQAIKKSEEPKQESEQPQEEQSQQAQPQESEQPQAEQSEQAKPQESEQPQ